MDLSSWGLIGLFLGTFLAATVVPFSSDALYIAVMIATRQPLVCLLVGSLGNWLGSVTTYFLGRLCKWEWLEKTFKVKRETLEKQKVKIDKYGVWLALISWVPIIGDAISIGLGFYKTPAFWTLLVLFIGKILRFGVWTLIYLHPAVSQAVGSL